MIRTLEKYELLEEIGHGGMATVYRARDTGLGRFVAVKLMHPHLRGAKEARARFRREAQSVARLEHPKILEIYDYSGEGSDESYIVTELLTGPTLKAYVESGPELPAEIAACFGIEIASALVAAHEKGIIHRDVKPENILLHDARCLKLTDFGIADMVDAQSMTATGQVLGSPGHMAPEQIEGHDVGPRADVFALGTVLYFLATGRLPFTGKNPHQILKRVLDGAAPDPLRFRPSIGGRFKAIVMKAMATSPEDRYPSAAALEAALRAYVAVVGIDDPEREIARFLADPVAATAALVPRVIRAEIELGKRASAERRLDDASDAFARVLALDEANEEVLALLARADRARRSQAGGRRAALVALALLVVSAGLALLRFAGEGSSLSEAALALEDAGRPTSAPPPASARVDASVEAPALDASIAVDASAAEADGTSRAPLVVELRPVRRDLALVRPRRVVLNPDPQNVQIGVDGQPPRAYGPSFESLELAVGRHTFVVETDLECCASATFEREIPAGEGAFTLALALPSRPAVLYVTANVPADVVVEGGAHGRAREAIPIPIRARSRSERRTITVTAPGHAAYTGVVELQAGTVLDHPVTLSRLEATEP